MGTLEKLGFFALAPSKVRDKKGKVQKGAKSYNTAKGAVAEAVNREIGGGVGLATGALGGAGVGKLLSKGKKGLEGGLIGGLAGVLTGRIRSQRKTEEVHGVKKTGVGRYMASLPFSMAGAAFVPVPLVGNYMGENLYTRKISPYVDATKSKTKSKKKSKKKGKK